MIELVWIFVSPSLHSNLVRLYADTIKRQKVFKNQQRFAVFYLIIFNFFVPIHTQDLVYRHKRVPDFSPIFIQ